MLASCISIAFCMTKLRRIRKKNADRIHSCRTPDRIVKKSVTPVLVLTHYFPVFWHILRSVRVARGRLTFIVYCHKIDECYKQIEFW